jgi:hypothetical protein
MPRTIGCSGSRSRDCVVGRAINASKNSHNYAKEMQGISGVWGRWISSDYWASRKEAQPPYGNGIVYPGDLHPGRGSRLSEDGVVLAMSTS